MSEIEVKRKREKRGEEEEEKKKLSIKHTFVVFESRNECLFKELAGTLICHQGREIVKQTVINHERELNTGPINPVRSISGQIWTVREHCHFLHHVSKPQVNQKIDQRWTRDACSIDHHSFLYLSKCCFTTGKSTPIKNHKNVRWSSTVDRRQENKSPPRRSTPY